MAEDINQYEVLYNSSPLAHYSMDENGIIVQANKRWFDLLGYDPEEVLGKKSIYDFVLPKYKGILLKRIREFKKLGESQEIILEWVLKDGSTLLNSCDGRPVFNENNEYMYSHCVLKDITRRQELERRFRNIVQCNPMGIHMYRLGGNDDLIFTGANPSADIILQIDHSKFIGKTIEEAFPSLVGTDISEKYKSLCKSNGGIFRVKDLEYKDKNIYGIFEVSAFQTSPGRMATMFMDVTELRKIKEDLINSEKRYRRLFESAKDGILILNAATGQIEDANPFLLDLLGYSYEEVLGKYIWDIGAFKDVIENKSRFLKLQQAGYVRYEDLPLETADGHVVEIEFVSNVYLVNSHKVIQCNIRDISDRKRIEFALNESEERVRRFYDATFEGIAVTRDSIIIDANKEFCDFYGYTYDELVNKSVLDLVFEGDRDLVASKLAASYEKVYAHRGLHKDGSLLYLEVRGKAITIDGELARITAIHNITDSKHNEERFNSLLSFMELDVKSEDQIIDYALEEAVRLTDSKIGYLHFVDLDKSLLKEDIKLELVKWSKSTQTDCTAEKVRHYPLEKAGVWADCVRKGTPVVHNDYPNNPTNKGLPKGHFPVLRHMSVPIFDGDRIVAVAGVGNKEKPYDEADVRQLSLFMNSMWDILRRVRVENELRKEKERLQTYLDVATSIFVVLDKEGYIQMINKRGCGILGCAMEEDVLGRNWLEEFIPEDEKERVLSEFQSLMDGDKDWSLMENAIINLYNERKIINWRNTVLRDNENVIAFTLSSGEDLTEQRALEAKQEEYWIKAEQMLTDNFAKIKKSTTRSSILSTNTNTALDDALKKLIEDNEE